MKIYNNYILLDQEIARIQGTIEGISRIRTSISKEMHRLHQSGFKDIKFNELKQRMDQSSNSLDRFEKNAKIYVEVLKNLSAIIKEYYRIAI